MAVIKKLSLTHFRNFQQISIDLSSGFNIVYGHNGSGKTSLLESIYLLGLGRSFRTHKLNRLIQQGCDQLVVFADIASLDTSHTISIEKSQHGNRQYHLDAQEPHSVSEIASLLPLQFISTFSYQYFMEGPDIRRRFMDWGLFHVKRKAFFPHWQRYCRALKQRNNALKQRVSRQEIAIWDAELVSSGELLHAQRKDYVQAYCVEFARMLQRLLPQYELTLRYQKGWASGRTLEQALSENYSNDLRLGYTSNGVHRADLQLYVGEIPVDDVLSQGQLKIAAYALYLSQGMHVSKVSDNSVSYLIDDLPSELDPIRRSELANVLLDLPGQVFVTGISECDVEELECLPDARYIDLDAKTNIV